MTARTRPPRLRRGDTVALVSPSGPVEPGPVQRAADLLASWGLRVRVGAHALDQAGYLAGTDADRAADFAAAWCDPEVAAILCTRGGYGAQRMLDLVDWAALRSAPPKLLLGSSDATALHEAVGRELGLVTLFGPMPASAVLVGDDPDEPSRQALHDALLAGSPFVLTADPGPVRGGTARGPLVGGTLSLLAASVGTRWGVPAGGAVAVLEDVAESAYRLDRLLTQLLRSGWFDGVRGVALGSWYECGADAVETVLERLAPLGVPVLAGLRFGHGRPQLSLPLGAEAVLDADAGTLAVAADALA